MRPRIDIRQLKARCQMTIADFALEPEFELRQFKYGMHLYKDNGSNILAVAHLDTVHNTRKRIPFRYGRNAKNEMCVMSPQLDDRLGTYIILDLLPTIGLRYDILLTENEESCNSTAQDFTSAKEYQWIFSFDRAGNDTVMYQYEDTDTAQRVRATGMRIGTGSYSCIADLEHLGVKAFNWGTAYYNNHSPNAYMHVPTFWHNLRAFTRFYDAHKTTRLPHVPVPGMFPQWNTRYAAARWDLFEDATIEKYGATTLYKCLECRDYFEEDEYDHDTMHCQECAYWQQWLTYGKSKEEEKGG